jgi:hypothetical protein
MRKKVGEILSNYSQFAAKLSRFCKKKTRDIFDVRMVFNKSVVF